MPITSSSSSKRIPITPMDTRPVVLTSFSLKRMHIPFLVTRKISCLSSVAFTSMSSSPSFSTIAWSPFLRTLPYSTIGVFFTIPSLVAIKRYWSSLNSLMGIMAVIFSPGWSCRRFTIAVPRAVRPASGISYAFKRYTRPVFVKNIMWWWLVVIRRSSI